MARSAPTSDRDSSRPMIPCRKQQLRPDTPNLQAVPVASGALLPLFAPVEVEGRLLGDGGLASNTPLDLMLDEPGEGTLHCIVLDLFAKSGPRPRCLTASLARAADVGFSNQTSRLLEGRAREYQLL